MPIRKLPGTPTVNAGVFWTEIVNLEGWKVQYNKTLDKYSPLKPCRLLGPDDVLWASADSPEELQEALTNLMEEIGRAHV